LETIKGISYAFFDATTGNYVANYTIDVTPPAVVSTNPVAGMTEVPNNVTVTATFNEAMDPATMTSSTFSLRNASNQIVPGTVSYNSSNQTLSLSPVPTR